MDAKDLRCPTTSTSSYGSESHTPPELIVWRDRDAAPSRRSSAAEVQCVNAHESLLKQNYVGSPAMVKGISTDDGVEG